MKNLVLSIFCVGLFIQLLAIPRRADNAVLANNGITPKAVSKTELDSATMLVNVYGFKDTTNEVAKNQKQ